MAVQRFYAILNGVLTGIAALVSSSGAADAGKIVATGSDGRLDESLMPVGIGANTTPATATEEIGAGKFVNFHSSAGALSIRLADNSNNRPANGFVKELVTSGAEGTVYPLDSTNAGLSGLTPGTRYFLGQAGAVIATPLDPAVEANYGKVTQFLGTAKSATELVTTDDTVILL